MLSISLIFLRSPGLKHGGLKCRKAALLLRDELYHVHIGVYISRQVHPLYNECMPPLRKNPFHISVFFRVENIEDKVKMSVMKIWITSSAKEELRSKFFKGTWQQDWFLDFSDRNLFCTCHLHDAKTLFFFKKGDFFRFFLFMFYRYICDKFHLRGGICIQLNILE